jgi:hypothetical protein
MSSHTEQSKLSNMYSGLHNLSDMGEMDVYRANYLFFTQMPMYVALEQKYKEAKKKVREQRKMIELLNRQNIEIMERYANRAPLYKDQTVSFVSETLPVDSLPVDSLTVDTLTVDTLSDRFSKIHIKQEHVPESKIELKENITYKIVPSISIDEEEDVAPPSNEVEVEDTTEEETEEEPEEVEVEVEETEETEEVEETEETEESEEVEETDEVEVEETEESEESEEVEVEESEEEEESEEVEVDETEETEEVEVEETEEEESEEVEVEEEEEEETEEVEVEEEEEESEEVEVEETEETEEEEGVYEVQIKGKRYYTTNEINGTIYAILADDEIGDEVGSFENGKPLFRKK